MPLIKGKSEKSFVKNMKTEMEHGHPQKQSLAIAYAMKRKAQHKAKGGAVHGSGCSCSQCMSDGGSVDSMSKGQQSLNAAFKVPPKPTPAPDQNLDEEYKAELNKQKYADGGSVDPKQSAQSSMRKAFGYAEGGQIKDNYQPSGKPHVDKEFSYEPAEKASGYMSHEGNDVKSNGPAMSEEHKKLNQHAVDMMASTSMSEQDIVDRIMEKRSQDFSGLARLSQGGKVANQEHGENNNELAGFSPNEFDDLVLRDDLESSYGDDDNSGDNLGNDQEDEDRHDIVARIMASRKKKDRMPNPA